ncbi:acyl-CoA N-acyltransferase [Xylariaceae sp. FL0804]|nr:acyl-CoA N-acyltransferase [Xylariaceae sp. FL0804]
MGEVKQRVKRKRAETDAIDCANRKSDEDFIKEHLRPRSSESSSSWPEWTSPGTRARYALSLVGAGRLAAADLRACLALIAETSRADYAASSGGWDPVRKEAEMRSPELRYILVREDETADAGHGDGDGDGCGGGSGSGSLRGFTSLMPTYEEGEPVVYCYEIHLKPELRGTGLASVLMASLERVAVHTPPVAKVMLTCFRSNARARRFYERSGFEEDPLTPRPRRLRSGRVVVPDYLIMSKKITRAPSTAGDADPGATVRTESSSLPSTR